MSKSSVVVKNIQLFGTAEFKVMSCDFCVNGIRYSKTIIKTPEEIKNAHKAKLIEYHNKNRQSIK